MRPSISSGGRPVYCQIAATTGILLQRGVAGRALVPDKKERARAVCCGLGIAQIDQYGRPVGCDADIVRFDIAVDDRRVLGVQEGDGITDGE